jgi:hypothetical protein
MAGIVSRHAISYMASGNLSDRPVVDFALPNSRYWVLPKGNHVSTTSKAFQAHVSQ